jgi:ankyrin repeat protein
MQYGHTALALAARNGHVNVVQCLVEAGVNLEAAVNVSDHVVWACIDDRGDEGCQ